MMLADLPTEAPDTEQEELPPAAAARTRLAATVGALSRLGTLWFLILLVVLARLAYPGFAEGGNLRNVFSQNAPIGLIAVGMTFAMICGGFDLSVGAIVAMSSVTYAKLALTGGLWQAAAVTLLLGLGLGLVNGLLVTRLGINPFIATLATASIYSGAAYLLSDSQPIVVDKPGFMRVGQGTLWGLPISVWLMGLAFLAGGLVLAGTVYGHCVYAVGGNKEAARLAGVRVDRIQVISYLIVGAMSALAGIVLSSRLSVGQADVGADMTLDVITIVVIGGTSLFGGEGAMWRTAVGLLLLGVIINVADSKGWSGNIENILKGCVLLGAVGLDVFVRRMRARRRRTS
jgi:ribose transport system permease protein